MFPAPKVILYRIKFVTKKRYHNTTEPYCIVKITVVSGQ